VKRRKKEAVLLARRQGVGAEAVDPVLGQAGEGGRRGEEEARMSEERIGERICRFGFTGSRSRG